MTKKHDVDELNVLLRSAEEKVLEAAISTSEVANQCCTFKVTEPGNYEEAFEFSMDGVQYTCADEMDIDIFFPLEKTNQLKRDVFAQELEDVDEVFERELTDAEELGIVNMLARSRGRVIADINEKLNERLTRELESAVSKVCEEKGITFEGWEECTQTFIIDGRKYERSVYDGDLEEVF